MSLVSGFSGWHLTTSDVVSLFDLFLSSMFRREVVYPATLPGLKFDVH